MRVSLSPQVSAGGGGGLSAAAGGPGRCSPGGPGREQPGPGALGGAGSRSTWRRLCLREESLF